MRTRNVLIVDDHPIVRQGLTQLIGAESDLDVCGDAASVDEALDLLESAEPDVVILDLSLPDSDGLELLKQIRKETRHLPVLVLSMHDESMYAERLLSAGANGYIMKQAAADQLLIALRRVLAGGVYVSEGLGSIMIERISGDGRRTMANPIERLSNRELQVLNLIGQGRTTREVAETLNLSVKTVESHRQRIKKKLNLQTSAQLVKFAVSSYAQ
ncbi:MAG: response regulator transcription factor [Gammaproteobacteria bacterium]